MRFNFLISIILVSFLALLTSCDKNITENSPPIAVFKSFPYAGNFMTSFVFDPLGSNDRDELTEKLTVMWDWQSDGNWDTTYIGIKPLAHRFSIRGIHKITMGIMDSNKELDLAVDSIFILPKPILSTMIDPRDNREYKTVNIDGHWWMAEDLKYGKLIPIDSSQKDNGIIEMYAYENNPETIEKYGGLYTWSETMQYNENEGSQGVCPPGWHIPSWDEWRLFSRDIPTITLTYYYGVDGPGGLNLNYGGRILRYYQILGRPIDTNLNHELNNSASFWTSTHDEEMIRNFQDERATYRRNLSMGIRRLEVGYNNDYLTGFRTGGDRIHLYGNTNAYYINSVPIVNAWYAHHVRCKKD